MSVLKEQYLKGFIAEQQKAKEGEARRLEKSKTTADI